VVYETPADKLERIPLIIAEIARAQPRARFDRAHFFEYGDFSLVFEIVYYVYGPDYVVYMDTQQAINLAIHRRFQEEGISFAYPTQELIVRRTPAAAGVV
jgi:small-conductance mechanosensitive channel